MGIQKGCLFFLHPAQSANRKQDFYSKFIGQKERVNGFEYWRNRIYWYIENSKYGIKWAAITIIKIPSEKKEPILTILGHGAEIANKTELSSGVE